MKKVIIFISGLFIFSIMLLLLVLGGPRTDVVLGNFKLSNDGTKMTLNVGVSSSAGYIRKVKQTSGSMDYYLTFYSTFGINSKWGAKDSFEIAIDKNVSAIYFYTGNNGYKQVLAKDEDGNWKIVGKKIDVEDKINKIVNNGPMTSSNPFDYINASKDIYNELLENKYETFKYVIEDLIESDASSGLKSYIEALLCIEINKGFKYDFESATDFLENYKDYLQNTNNLNYYDKYAKELLKDK